MVLQFGIWSLVCGGWLRVVNHEANLSTQDLEHTAQAEARLEAIYRSADEQQIKYFQAQIDPNVVAHNKLDISQTIEANLGLSAQLVGDRYTIIQRLKEYEAVGVDLIVLKFESMLEDTIRFHKLVISEYAQQNSLIQL